MGVLQSLLLGLSHVPWQPGSHGPLLPSLLRHRDEKKRTLGMRLVPWEVYFRYSSFPNSSSTRNGKQRTTLVLPLNHYYICYLEWDTEEGLSCLLCFPYTDKIKLLRSTLLKIAKCANEGKNTKPKCRSFLRFKNSLFLNEAKCNTFCYFFFTICKVYYNVSCSTVVDSWNCEIACISNKRPLLET